MRSLKINIQRTKGIFSREKMFKRNLGNQEEGLNFQKFIEGKLGTLFVGERNGMFGKKQSQEAIMASSTKVFQFNSNGEFIKEFISISEVKRKFGIGKKILKRNIKNGTPVMGFIWKYER